ncbi:MAG: gas vesicle protein GvpG [Gemmatimonadota bacterium]
MGLLKHLLFWPVTGPEFLVKFSLGKVEETVRRELTDDQSVKEDLLALQMQLELGEIDDAEYVEREAELMRRLREVRQWREELGMGIAGGPVRVARSEVEDASEEAAPDDTSDDAGGEPPRGGIASSGGASVELDLGRDDR